MTVFSELRKCSWNLESIQNQAYCVSSENDNNYLNEKQEMW